MMIPIRTRTPKPTRELVTKEKNFQTLVEDWLVSNALAALNHHQHLKKPPLVSGNSEHIQVLVLHLDTVAAQEFSHDDTDHDTDRGRPSTYRLSLGKIYASNERRAKWVIEHWDRSKIERRSQGGKHGSHDGTRKGPTPRFTYGDLRPYWDLPPRERMPAAVAGTGMAGTGMSRRTFYKLKPGMNDFIARMELARQERETNGPDLDRLLP